jgi:hypothetical protein
MLAVPDPIGIAGRLSPPYKKDSANFEEFVLILGLNLLVFYKTLVI